MKISLGIRRRVERKQGPCGCLVPNQIHFLAWDLEVWSNLGRGG